VLDGRGGVASCAITSTQRGRVVARVLDLERRPRRGPEIVVYQGAAKGRKNDDVIERLAQVGVACVSVFESRRAVVRWDARKRDALAVRWASLARSVAKQSRSPFVAGTRPPLEWRELVDAVGREPCPIVLYEEAAAGLHGAPGEGERIALVVGPEGGFERGEVEQLARAGARVASLGEQILRTENAALVAASALLWHHGLIG
jgi:16S rRNA (uracil1498-N3)-methyltransferase